MMQVFVVDRKSGRVRRLGLRASLLLAAGGSLLAMAGMLVVYQISSIGAGERAALARLASELAEQRHALEAARFAESSQRAALGRRVGEVQARLMRIEALGQRVASAAGIADGEFDFDSAPALGGPETLADIDPVPVEGLLQRIDGDLRRKEAQFEALTELIEGRSFVAVREPSGRPVRAGWISSRYGKRIDPITGVPAWHSGIDIAGRRGSDVVAVAAGVVIGAGAQKGLGRYIDIDHGNGWKTRYAHLEEIRVDIGDIVDRGQTIATMGSSGRSTGPHLHFEVRRDGRQVNPAVALNAR